METATQILNDILKLVAKKRFDLLIGNWGINEDFDKRMRKCLKEHNKYTENISNKLIEKIYNSFKELDLGCFFPRDLWKFIIKMNKNLLPKEVGLALALSSFALIPDVIANSHQNLEVYFAAADNSKYARSRLCIRLFIEAKYSVKDLKRYLDKYGKKSALRILQNRKPSSDDKYNLFTKAEIKDMQEQAYYEDLDNKTKKQQRRNDKRTQIILEKNEEIERIWQNKNR